jgi:hypothetical protein
VLADYAPAAKATQDIGQITQAILHRLSRSQAAPAGQPGKRRLFGWRA